MFFFMACNVFLGICVIKRGKEKNMRQVPRKCQVSLAHPHTSDLITSEVNKVRKQTEVIPKGELVVSPAGQGSFPVPAMPETCPPSPTPSVPSPPFWEVWDYGVFEEPCCFL